MFATSSGSPKRPIGVFCWSCVPTLLTWRSSPSQFAPWVISERIRPAKWRNGEYTVRFHSSVDD